MHPETPPRSDGHRRSAACAGTSAPPRPGEPEQNAPDSPAGATSGIPVVGLGGSAGALEPFRRFLAALPAESGAAFVVIQHLAPTHQSLLTELLAQHTRMRMVDAQDAVPVEANCVYVIPPHKYLGIRDVLRDVVDSMDSRSFRPCDCLRNPRRGDSVMRDVMRGVASSLVLRRIRASNTGRKQPGCS